MASRVLVPFCGSLSVTNIADEKVVKDNQKVKKSHDRPKTLVEI